MAKATDDTKKKSTGSCIEYCGCDSPQQDTLHGLGRRVKNYGKDGLKRCTVCGKES